MRFRQPLSWLLGLALFGPAEPPAALAQSPDAGAPPAAAPALPSAPTLTEEEMAPPEAPGPARSARGASARREVVVAAGDSLSAIAHREGVSVATLATVNGIGRDAAIRIGQRLVIPAAGEKIRAPAQVHLVVSGDTLGAIARRYGVTIEVLLEANSLRRGHTLRIGQSLSIPGAGGALPAAPERGTEARAPVTGMQQLDVPGSSAPAYYFEPTGPGRNGMRPVIVYLHGRGAEPRQYCRRWAHVAQNLGWLVCPSGPEDRGEGKRGWSNNWYGGKNVVMGAIDALRRKFGRRVQLYGNTLVGFSEGAYIAMNVGLREPRTFNRWLILGADPDYWGAAGLQDLPDARGRVRRVYLITGRRDDVVDDTALVRQWLKKAGVPVRISTPRDMGHEVALETKPVMYQAALHWLAEG